jgi:hypothetical protein
LADFLALRLAAFPTRFFAAFLADFRALLADGRLRFLAARRAEFFAVFFGVFLAALLEVRLAVFRAVFFLPGLRLGAAVRLGAGAGEAFGET